MQKIIDPHTIRFQIYIKMFHQNVFQVPTYHTYVWSPVTGCLERRSKNSIWQTTHPVWPQGFPSVIQSLQKLEPPKVSI